MTLERGPTCGRALRLPNGVLNIGKRPALACKKRSTSTSLLAIGRGSRRLVPSCPLPLSGLVAYRKQSGQLIAVLAILTVISAPVGRSFLQFSVRPRLLPGLGSRLTRRCP